MQLEGLGQLKKIYLIGTQTCDLPACSIVPQLTTLTCAPVILQENIYCLEMCVIFHEDTLTLQQMVVCSGRIHKVVLFLHLSE
jgi:hypothetical protein